MASVQVFRARIRQGHEDEVKSWAAGLADRSETYEALRSEGVLVESVFVEERDGRTFLWVYQRLADATLANERFMASTNPVDVELRDIMKRAWEAVDFFPLVLDYAAPG